MARKGKTKVRTRKALVLQLLSEHLKQLGSRGGRTSSANMTAGERKARAKKAAAARWSKRQGR